MTTAEQRRAWVLTKVIAGEVEATEAALVRVEVSRVHRLGRQVPTP